MALLCWRLMPDIAELKTLNVSWMLLIVARDLAVTIGVAGFWDFLLYSQWSPLRAKAHPAKFNPKYPSFVQIKHDRGRSARLCSPPHGRSRCCTRGREGSLHYRCRQHGGWIGRPGRGSCPPSTGG
jgi:hypothetical protein